MRGHKFFKFRISGFCPPPLIYAKISFISQFKSFYIFQFKISIIFFLPEARLPQNSAAAAADEELESEKRQQHSIFFLLNILKIPKFLNFL